MVRCAIATVLLATIAAGPDLAIAQDRTPLVEKQNGNQPKLWPTPFVMQPGGAKDTEQKIQSDLKPCEKKPTPPWCRNDTEGTK
jgi:hypothetical protein